MKIKPKMSEKLIFEENFEILKFKNTQSFPNLGFKGVQNLTYKGKTPSSDFDPALRCGL